MLPPSKIEGFWKPWCRGHHFWTSFGHQKIHFVTFQNNNAIIVPAKNHIFFEANMPSFRPTRCVVLLHFGWPKINFESSWFHEISNLKKKFSEQICPAFSQLGYDRFSEPRNHSICADLRSDLWGKNQIYPEVFPYCERVKSFYYITHRVSFCFLSLKSYWILSLSGTLATLGDFWDSLSRVFFSAR